MRPPLPTVVSRGMFDKKVKERTDFGSTSRGRRSRTRGESMSINKTGYFVILCRAPFKGGRGETLPKYGLGEQRFSGSG